jgi:hypothetical protein
MDQSTLETSGPLPPSDEEGSMVPLPYLSAEEADPQSEGPFVVVARNALELCRWLVAESSSLQWIQVENLLDEPEVWATAARKGNDAALDIIVADPATQYASIYRLVDVRNVRPVRVTIPVVAGFLKSLRLAVSVQLPVRLLPGQPGPEVIAELEEALEYYLHDPMVEVPVEFFHSMLALAKGGSGPDLWVATEQDPDVFALPDWSSPKEMGFVDRHVTQLEAAGAECSSCPWKIVCRGFFNVPDPEYSCAGIITLFDRIGQAGAEMKKDLAAFDTTNESATGKAIDENS